MRILCLVSLMSMAMFCKPQSDGRDPHGFDWDTGRVTKDLETFAAEPHPMGSPRNHQLADYIEAQMKASGLATARQTFEADVPDPDFLGRDASMMQKTTLSLNLTNVTAQFAPEAASTCVYLLGSHYDSKRLDEGPSVGANDSGSSSAALLELMRQLSASRPDFRCKVMAVWFDGEEAYLPQWRDGETRHPAGIVDNTYGSRRFVDSLQACGAAWCLDANLGGDKIEGLILLDMIGGPKLRLSPELNSTPALMKLAREIDEEIFAGELYGRSSPKAVEDDHIPFIRKGIPAVDLIGFESIEHWHRPSDTIDKVDVESMKRATTLAHALLHRLLAE